MHADTPAEDERLNAAIESALATVTATEALVERIHASHAEAVAAAETARELLAELTTTREAMRLASVLPPGGS